MKNKPEPLPDTWRENQPLPEEIEAGRLRLEKMSPEERRVIKGWGDLAERVAEKNRANQR